MTDAYLNGFEAWASDILARCDQAVVVAPDKIDGNHEDNWELILQAIMMFDTERIMPVWHLHEPIYYLLNSSGQYRNVGTPAWHARIAEALRDGSEGPVADVTDMHNKFMREQW